MDPLSAFGLAASIAQFITFATTLIHKSIEIYGSGSTAETKSLEDTYETLSRFSHRLGVFGRTHNNPELRDQALSLESLSNSCQNDCDKLLHVVSKLKAEGSARRRVLKTFRAAWAACIKDDKIATLERRLGRSQATLTLCVCQMSKCVKIPESIFLPSILAQEECQTQSSLYSYYLHFQSDKVSDLKREAMELRLHQDKRLLKIQTTLDEFKLIIQEKEPENAGSFSVADIEALRRQISALDTLNADVARDHSFLDSLRFRRQPERHKSVPKAHRQTFSWILDPLNRHIEASKLRLWLQQTDTGIFWVSGKPGSGKSTLMKFVADHEETRKFLSTWAQGRKLIVASHYFWWSGTVLQKSQEGLLRTLLYSILRQCPELIRIVCDEKCARGLKTSFNESERDDTDSWTLEELQSAFSAIAHHPDLGVKFCFFIDGLDEYKGDHKDICDAFIGLVRASSAIKICLSSRPWNVFKQAFGNSPERIYIHDLTREDMRVFAQSRLSEHPQWNPMSLESPGVQGLVNEITERAQGVFLWVFIVTGLLREGLDNGDNLSDLRLRLETFPTDLKRFFRDILEKIDSFYHTKVSAVLQIALAAEEPLNVSLYAFLEEEFENQDYAIEKQISVLSEKAVAEQHRKMEQRLNGWSKGLVEVRNQEVHFLHRTVVDFLRTCEMEDFVAENLPPWFCIGLSLLKAHLAWIKTTAFGDSMPGLPSTIPSSGELRVTEALKWAFEIESTVPLSSPVHHTAGMHLDDMERSIEKLHASADGDILGEKPKSLVQGFFRKSVLHGHLAVYLSRKLLISPDYFQVLAEPALSILIDEPVGIAFSTTWPNGWIDTLRCLLANGQDPNREYRDPETTTQACTPWIKFLTTVIAWDELRKCATQGDLFDNAVHNGLFSLFLEHGGNPNALMFRTGASFPIFSTAWVDMLLMSFEVSSKPLDEEAYLKELDAFVRHGAKIDAASKSTIVLTESKPGAPAWDAFFSQLTPRIKSGKCNTGLLQRVTRIMLVMMQNAGLNLDGALKEVDTAFCAVISERLRRDFEARGKSAAGDRKKRKKRRGGKPLGGGNKRQRMLK